VRAFVGLAHFEANFIGDIKFKPIKYRQGPFKQTSQVFQIEELAVTIATSDVASKKKLSRQIQLINKMNCRFRKHKYTCNSYLAVIKNMVQ